MNNIKEVLEKHAAWLRNEEGGERANLHRANLSGADLSGADLYKADLSGADLYGANLTGADLYGANLTGANLYGANLSGADLYKANLTGANLTAADLSGANLSGADLSGAKQVILQFIASRHQVVSIDDDVKIGCKCSSLAWWLENYKQVGESEKYTPDQIEEYGLILRHIEAALKIRKKHSHAN